MSAGTTTHDIQVGDCFSCSWGYDQTNAEYFRVDRVTAKSVELVAIGAIVVDEHGGGTSLAPDPHTEREWTVLFGGGRNRKLCRVKRSGWSGTDEGPYAILSAGSSWSCTYNARPVRGFAYDNSKVGR